MPMHSKLSTVEVADIIYCGVVVKYTNPKGGVQYYSIEKFPQNPKQQTQSLESTDDIITEYPDRTNVDNDEVLAYWVANSEKNGDGSRKGGAFAKANFSLNGIGIGEQLEIEILKHNPHNTEVMVRRHGAEPFKAFACTKPSPQFAVDTYIMSVYIGKLYVRLIKRAASGPTSSVGIPGSISASGPDYPNGWAIIGGFLDGAKTVLQGRENELREEGGILIGKNLVSVIEMDERCERGREPRYMPFSYVNAAQQVVTFGYERGSFANSVIHFVNSHDGSLPRLSLATDTDEVIKGEWILLSEFLAYSNDPAADRYVPWMDHQKGARDAAELLVQMDVVNSDSF